MTAASILFRLARIFVDFKKRSEAPRALPIRLWVESSSACNLKCPMCLNKDMPASEKGLMSLDLFKKIVAEARRFVNDMYLHHRGEPLLNPALCDMIVCAREAGIKTRFHTNGTLLTEEKARGILEAGPRLVSFSVDGFEKDAYEKIRVGTEFEETRDNILRFVEMRRSMGLRRPYVVVEKIRFKHPDSAENADKVSELRKRFLTAGVDEVIEKEEYVWAQENAPDPAEPRTSAVCTFPWYAMVVCADGAVTPCPQDYWAKMKMGDVNDASLAEIWNGPEYRRLRRSYKADIESLLLCRTCDRLRRKTIGGIPFQYAITFLADQLVGYGRLRGWLGTSERN